MIATITGLTLRQLLGKWRVVLLGLMAALPIVMAVVFRLADPADVDRLRWTARTLLSEMVVAFLMPMAALIFGTAAFGSEAEDGTAVYLLSKPISRWAVLAAKVIASWLATIVFVLPAALVSGLIAGGGEAGIGRLILAFLVALAAGSAVYSVLFVALGIMTSRAFIAGLAYVFIWESLVTRLFGGTRILSVRNYTLTVAEALADVPARVFDARLSTTAGISMLIVVSALALFLGLRRLKRYELGEAG